ncbi:hypothetical protein GCM10012275_54130 [Longimycelium tulufanense]|uniref:HTTM-like domain-containing protein n=1 Tax=Longimycelium tulufanense TaxID=907463 RepID=A0A8J3FZ14_9PSEU|nr:sporulation-delaying protein SdpB family protein [Longimycelium tulufanense]GGM76579.1 hypothetical protein GCM10012275_54130 [Longimycelium tulufanense]
MLSKLNTLAHQIAARTPWTNVYGLARSLIALGTLSTLLFTSTDSLFRPSYGIAGYPQCGGVASIGLFCVVPRDHLEWARLIAVLVLIVTAIGWRPRVTALPHWWITFSLQASATIPDGGDQISANIALLLLPVALTDSRRWHWDTPIPAERARSRVLAWSLVAWSALFVIRLQVAGLYLQASMAKLGEAEWRDGTAFYYWSTDPLFGLPEWAAVLLSPVLRSSVGVILLTWGPIVVEFALFLGLVARRAVRPYLLAAGIALHASIALVLGLGSFALAMMGCLVLFLRPTDHPFTRLETLCARAAAVVTPWSGIPAVQGRRRRRVIAASSMDNPD